MNLYQKRIKKAKILAKLLSSILFVRMIALTGSLARSQARRESDIDFFIVTKDGRIWTTRFFIVFLLKLLGQYRTDKNIAGKICPNRWQTNQTLKITPQNLYHAKEYSQIIPLFEMDNIYQKFQKENQWMIRKFKIPNSKIKMKNQNLKIKENYILKSIRQMGERILGGHLGDFLEEKFKNYQIKRILWDRRTYQKKARVIISDKMLCFHPEGR